MLHCRSCNARGDANFALLHVGARDDGGAHSYLCRRCGFGFTIGSFDRKPDDVYLSGEFSVAARNSKGPASRKKQRASKSSAAARAKRLLGVWKMLKRQEGRSLEVGCGLGSFAAFLQKRGWHSEGIEPDPDFARFGSEMHGIEIHPCLFEDYEFNGQPFDLLSAFHVFEHVNDPHQFLRDSRKVLADDGVLYLEIPSLDSPHRRTWSSFFWTFHPNVLTRRHLKKLMEHHGFSDIRSGRVGKFVYIFGMATPRRADTEFLVPTWFDQAYIALYLRAFYAVKAMNKNVVRWRRIREPFVAHLPRLRNHVWKLRLMITPRII